MRAATSSAPPARERSQLIIDFDEARIRAAEHSQELASRAPTPDEVLTSYLSLVYTMRHRTPGERVPLRVNDLKVLSRALELSVPVVEDRLTHLMDDPDHAVSVTVRRRRARVLVPVAGVIVAATAIGTILLVGARAESTAGTSTSAAVTATATATAAATPAPVPAVVGPAQVIERGGTQHERGPGDD